MRKHELNCAEGATEALVLLMEPAYASEFDGDCAECEYIRNHKPVRWWQRIVKLVSKHVVRAQ